MENVKSEIKLHTANIYNREKIEIVGVVEILSSSENQVIAKVCDYITEIYGSGLKVSKLDPEEKLLTICGKIDGLKYEKKLNKKSFLGKVFK